MANFVNFNLLLIASFFFLSLVGAVVLFKFFKSTAAVQSKQYQAGGAIAGFIIIFMLLTFSYERIKNDTEIQQKNALDSTRQELDHAKEKLLRESIEGVITPYASDTKIVLAVQQTEADMQGKFKFSATCIDPDTDDVKLYLISPGKFKFMRIDSKQAMKRINFPTN